MPCVSPDFDPPPPAILPHGHNGEPRDEEGKPLDPSKVAGLPSNHPDKKKLEGIITDNVHLYLFRFPCNR